MGAYEYSIARLEREDSSYRFTWSALPNRAYSMYTSDNLLDWILAEEGIQVGGSYLATWLDETASGSPASSTGPCSNREGTPA